MDAMTCVIGIDPGVSGGVAILRGADVETHSLKSLTEQDFWRLLAEHEPATVYLEEVSSTPQMGVKSAFTFGAAYGMARMAAIAAGLRLVTVRPNAWQTALKLPKVGGEIGKNGTAKKNRNKARAQELFPTLRVTHLNADALLIAEYGRRLNLEGEN